MRETFLQLFAINLWAIAVTGLIFLFRKWDLRLKKALKVEGICLMILLAVWLIGSGEAEKSNNGAETKKTPIPIETFTPTPTSDPVKVEEEYKSSCEEYKYKDVLRNPEEYVGKRIKITVKISSVHEKTWLNDTKYYMAYSQTDYGWYGDRYGVFDLRKDQTFKLLEDDIITVYGEISDPEYTKSLIVNGSEIFCIDMKYIDFIGE